jgi:hypothetical protein
MDYKLTQQENSRMPQKKEKIMSKIILQQRRKGRKNRKKGYNAKRKYT